MTGKQLKKAMLEALDVLLASPYLLQEAESLDEEALSVLRESLPAASEKALLTTMDDEPFQLMELEAKLRESQNAETDREYETAMAEFLDMCAANLNSSTYSTINPSPSSLSRG